MNRRTRILLIIGVVVLAYIAYRFWRNGGSVAGGAGVDTSGTGSNLNSVAPELAGGSGPNSGLNYYPGNTQLDISLPGSNEAESNPPSHVPPKKSPKAMPKPPKWRGKPIRAPKGAPVFKPPVRRPPTKKA
jgi:hypothetical protein